jgi:Zn-dependent peptidase ImmA (M78 family)
MEKSEMRIVARHLAKAPVDLQAIFRDLGIDYEEIGMFDASGSISRTGDGFTVTVNASESENRRRFTAAHELAHYLLHRDLMGDGQKMNRHIDTLYGGKHQSGDVLFRREHEIQANRIAAQILMPKALVTERFTDNPDAGTLAKDFGVSKAAMEIRLKTLGLTA